MRRRRRMGDEALRIPEIVRNVDELQRVQKAETGLLVAAYIKRDDGAARAHLTLGELVLRMARQPGIDDPRHLRVVFEKAGDRLGRAALPLDPQFQRLQ